MRTNYLIRLVTSTLIFNAGCALAQTQPMGAPPAPLLSRPSRPVPPDEARRPENTVEIKGTIQSYLVNFNGEVEGLLLKDGRQLHLPPHLSNLLQQCVKPSDKIAASVEPGVSSAYGQEFRVISLTTSRDGQTINDKLPGAPPSAANPQLTAKRKVVSCLVGHMGVLCGVVLSDGSQLHFSPAVAQVVNNRIAKGDQVSAQGFGIQSNVATSIDVLSMTVNGKNFSVDDQPL